MKIGIIINTNEPETVWNAFRFGVTSLLIEHEVKLFLLGKGVESESIQDKKFNVQEQIGLFVEHKGQIFACGTSVARVLEANTTAGRLIRSGRGWTDKFIYPPQTLKVVDRFITNFHQPQSTMIMLVCAFSDKDLIMKAYKKAVKEKYRFYSYGDAMFII